MLYLSLFCLNLSYKILDVYNSGGAVVPNSDVYKYSDPDELSPKGRIPLFPSARARPSDPRGDLRILRPARPSGKPGRFSRNFECNRLSRQEISSYQARLRISRQIENLLLVIFERGMHKLWGLTL